MRLVEKQKAERRARVVAVASELITKGGVEALTMSRVADGAGVTVPTVYNLVGNRDAVLTAVMDDAREGFLAKLATADDARREDEAEVIVVIEAFVNELADRGRLYQPLVQSMLQSGDDRSHVVIEALTPRIRNAMTSLKERGALADWAEIEFTTSRICALVLNAGWTWSLRQMGTESLRRCVVYDVAAHLAGISRGEARGQFERIAARHQRPGPSEGRNGTSAITEEGPERRLE